MKIGIISDTHDLLRPEVLEKLRGCGAILHAGDISSQAVVDQLREIAPLYIVRGNADREWAAQIPAFLDCELAGLRIFMTHKKKDLPEDVSPYKMVVFGHSHQYYSDWLGQTLFLNPGSCGPRRFVQPITMAVMEVDADGSFQVKRVEIPHTPKEKVPKVTQKDIRQQIELVVSETQKGKSPAEIASRHGLDAATAEQIARLYVTHPGVTTEGIMAKMGL